MPVIMRGKEVIAQKIPAGGSFYLSSTGIPTAMTLRKTLLFYKLFLLINAFSFQLQVINTFCQSFQVKRKRSAAC